MAEGSDKNALLVVGGLTVVGALGYVFWYAPALQRRRQFEAQLLQQAKAAGGPSWADTLSIGACMGLGAYYHVPPNVSSGICKKYAPGLVRQGVTDAINTTKGGIKGTVSGVKSAAGSVGGAFYDAGKSVVQPVAGVFKSAGSFISKLF